MNNTVDLITLTGQLRFYAKFNGEIPRGICADALAEIERLRDALSNIVALFEPDTFSWRDVAIESEKIARAALTSSENK